MHESVRIFRFYGLSETALRERLDDILHLPQVSAETEAHGQDILLRLHAQDAAILDTAAQAVQERTNVYLYSTDSSDLPTRVVHLLQHHGKTIAFAESCTGGMIASAVTGVAGASQVFGTGVVSYSGTCKEKMLHVHRETLRRYGAVSAQTAAEMARGVRATSGADIGISVTGEAGPHPAEQPVGTVYIALADRKRTWVQEWHLDTPDADRESIRRAAAGHALDLARRYLEAYPAVMAGGDIADEAESSRDRSARRTPNLLPLRGDSRRKKTFKIAAWLLALLVLVGGIVGIYQYMNAPTDNRELQDSLRNMYRNDTSVITDEILYPEGMTAQFRNLYDMNVNIGGWLRINDTVIDYPVMLHSGGYYQTHSFTDELSYYGQPYMNSADYAELMDDARVRIIYGNNTEDEQMFSTLLSYRRPAFLRQHPRVEFNTLFDTAAYEIFAVMVADGSEDAVWQYEQTDFAGDAQYMRYIEAIRARSLFDCDVTVAATDRLLLLSTNAQREYGRTDARLVIAAKRITTTDAAASPAYRWNSDVRMPESWQTKNRATQTTRATTTSTIATTTTATTLPAADDAEQTKTTTTTTTTETTLQDTQTTTVTDPTTEKDDGGDMETEENDNTGD